MCIMSLLSSVIYWNITIYYMSVTFPATFACIPCVFCINSKYTPARPAMKMQIVSILCRKEDAL